MSRLQLLAEEDGVVSLDELAAVRLDPVVLIASASRVVLGVTLGAQERLVGLVHVILMHPEHTDVAAIFSLLASVLPTVVKYLVHGIVRHALHESWVRLLVDPLEGFLEVHFALLLLVDGHFLPGVNEDLCVLVADVDLILLEQVNHLLRDLIRSYMIRPALLDCLLHVLVDRLNKLHVVAGHLGLVQLDAVLVELDCRVLEYLFWLVDSSVRKEVDFLTDLEGLLQLTHHGA